MSPRSTTSLRWLGMVLCALLGLGTIATAQTPILSAGPDRLLLPSQTSVRLTGQYNTSPWTGLPSGFTITWSQAGGPPATIVDGNTLRPTVFPSHPGTIHMRLKVFDPRFGLLGDDCLIHVLGAEQDAALNGEPRVWHKLEMSFTHDAELSETGPVNPFLDYRLTVYFLNIEKATVRAIPGYFAADGNAAETSADSGNVWRVNFVPEHAGTWYYIASFRTGPNVALNPSPAAGRAVSFDNANGVLVVEPSDPNAPGFLSKGRLDYTGEHLLHFAGTGAPFLKNGAGSPENFFGYYEFDGTTDQGGDATALNNFPPFDGLHHFDAHLADYVDLGVPLWKNGKGKRIFGAISYLASRGVNSLYALSFNTDGGDGREVWPWVDPTDKLHFDVSKLAQWERVVDHMQRAGVAWQVITQEMENDHALDGGGLGVERKLYYRELVARFGHALGLVWNLGEENTNTPEERRAFADYLRQIDPYRHPISIHNLVGDIPGTFGTLLGTHLEMVSIQGDPTNTPPRARQLVFDSEAAGRSWVVNFDEQSPARDGIVPDSVDFWHDLIRRETLWPMLLGQGGGCSWYFGYGNPNTDLDCEDFRSRDNHFRLAARAIEFLRAYAPVDRMTIGNELATGNDPSVLARRGETYVVYLPFGGPSTLDLQHFTGDFLVSWFDARNGGALVNGDVTQVNGPGVVSLGLPPAAGDWVALVRSATNLPPSIDSVAVMPSVLVAGRDFSIEVFAQDPNGPSDTLSVSATLIGPAGTPPAQVVLRRVDGGLYSFFVPDAPANVPGTWQAVVTVQDQAGLSATQTKSFQVQ